MCHLDFYLKASWRSTLRMLEQAAAACGASIMQDLQLSSQLRDAAADLEMLSSDRKQEAEQLKTLEQASRQQRRARSLP